MSPRVCASSQFTGRKLWADGSSQLTQRVSNWPGVMSKVPESRVTSVVVKPCCWPPRCPSAAQTVRRPPWPERGGCPRAGRTAATAAFGWREARVSTVLLRDDPPAAGVLGLEIVQSGAGFSSMAGRRRRCTRRTSGIRRMSRGRTMMMTPLAVRVAGIPNLAASGPATAVPIGARA